jgi:hypothetical protein
LHEDHLTTNRVKHLELIQAIIARLGNSSFLIKGATLTIGSAFFGIMASHLSWKIALTAFIPLITFWALDAYYLRQERLFRLLYTHACQPDDTVQIFSMDLTLYQDKISTYDVAFSVTLRYFYGSLVGVNFVFLVGAVLHELRPLNIGVLL